MFGRATITMGIGPHSSYRRNRNSYNAASNGAISNDLEWPLSAPKLRHFLLFVSPFLFS